MEIKIFSEHSDLPQKDYEKILLYDWGNFRKYDCAKNMSNNEVWPVGTHDKDGNVAFFIYGEANDLDEEPGGFEIKKMQYNKKLGKFGGEWFKDFVFDSVLNFEDWNKPVINGNITTYEKKYKYVWFYLAKEDDKKINSFVKHNFKTIIVEGRTCYKINLK